jgi:DNA integrity scanning protein DisA with diadenylate cyclase activity
MIRIVFIFLLTFSFVYSGILNIHKKIIPISLLQIKEIINKDKKIINIVIIANKNEEINALSLKESFPKKIKSYRIKITIIYEKNWKSKIVQSKIKYDAIYLFPLKKREYKKIINYANINNIVTFSYNFEGLKIGSLLYIEFTNKITIYLNKKTMKNLDITLNNRFLNMVKLYEK